MEEHSGGFWKKSVTAVLCGRTGLLILMTGYTFLGAVLFKFLEGGVEDVPAVVQKSREDCLRELWTITERLNVLYEKNWTILVTEQLKKFERVIVESGKSDGMIAKQSPNWTFGGALLYSITLLTTVGYSRLSPNTTLGKIASMIYAFVGVPLMLLLLSALGSLLAKGTRRSYTKLCCQSKPTTHQSVLYHRAQSSPASRRGSKSTFEDVALTQISPQQNSNNCKPNHVAYHHHSECQEMPKRAIVATVRASHARGGCRQTQVRQMLAEPHLCPQHSVHVTSKRIGTTSSDVEDTEDGEDNEHSATCTHDTPSRIPLIWRPDDVSSSSLPPSVPTSMAIIIIVIYLALGMAIFSNTSGWDMLDSVYFCFLALSTIGVGESMPRDGKVDGEVQLITCCAYLFLGLVLIAMCFSLVQEDVNNRCRHVGSDVGMTSQ